MSSDIEQRVVEMRFDNTDFEVNVEQSIETLKNLEKQLQLSEGTKGFSDVNKAASKTDFSPVVAAIDGVRNGFSAMEVVAITAISNITSKAMRMGEMILNALAITPIKSGFAEYGQQMDSTMVIMSNTGRSLEDVTNQLAILNEYADQTVYSFGDMTTAIGKFAAAGVNLEDSVSAIKGLSNAAAMVGANGSQLYSAYYNLAQSLQMGYLQTIDWNSLSNSTIGNKTMREEFIKTAIELGKFAENSEQAKKAYSDFKGSLSDKWLTSDVIIATLNKYVASEEDISAGLDTLGVKATKAATEVKSLKQMWDTLTEEAQTNWADSWNVIIGNLEEAKKFWTAIAEKISSVISLFGEARLSLLNAWKDNNGRDALIDAIYIIIEGFTNLIKTVRQAITEVFPITGKELADLTKRLRYFVKAMSLSEEASSGLKETIKAVLQPVKELAKVVKFLVKVTATAILLTKYIVQSIFLFIQYASEIPTIIDNIFGEGSWEKVLSSTKSILNSLGIILISVASTLYNLAATILPIIFTIIKGIGTILGGLLVKISQSEQFAFVVGLIKTGLDNLFNVLKKVNTKLKEFFDTFTFDSFSGMLASGANSAGDFVMGVVEGLTSGTTIGKIKGAASALGSVLVAAFRGKDGIDAHSPAKTAIKASEDFIDGGVKGLRDGETEIHGAASNAGKELAQGFASSTKEGLKDASADARQQGADYGKQISEGISDSLDPRYQKINQKNVTLEQSFKEMSENIQGTNEAISEDSAWDVILEKLKTAGEAVLGFLKTLTVGKVIVIGFSVAIASLIIGLGKLLANGAELAEGIGRLAKAIAGRIRAESFDKIAGAILKIAEAIAILTATVYFAPDAFNTAKNTIIGFAVAIGILVIAMTYLNTKLVKTKEDIGKGLFDLADMFSVSVLMLAFSSSIFILVKALKELSSFEATNWAGLVALLSIVTVFSYVMTKIISIGGKASIGVLTLIGFALAVRMLSKTLMELSDYLATKGGLQDFVVALIAISALIGRLGIAMTYISNSAGALCGIIMSLGGVLTSLGIIFAIVIYNIRELSKYTDVTSSMKGIYKILKTIAEIMIVMAVFATAISALSMKFKTIVPTLQKLSACVAVVGGTFTLLTLSMTALYAVMASDNDMQGTVKNLAKVLIGTAAGLTVLVAALAVILKVVTKFADNAYSDVVPKLNAIGLFAMAFSTSVSVLMLSFGAVVGMLNGVNSFASIGIAFGALLALMASITGIIILVAKYANDKDLNVETINSFSKLLLALSTTVAIISLVFTLMARSLSSDSINVKGMVASIIAVSLIMGAIAGLIVVIGRNANDVDAKGLFLPLIVVFAMMTELLAAIIYMASFCDPTSLIAPVLSIVALMGAIAGVIVVLGKLPQNEYTVSSANGVNASGKGSPLGSLIALFAGIALIFAAVIALGALFQKDFNGTLAACISSFVLIGAILGSIVVLTKISKNVDSQGVAGLGIMMASMSISLLAMASAVKILSGIPVPNLVAGAIALTAMMTVMVVLTKWLSKTNSTDLLAAAAALTTIAISVVIMASAIAIISKSLEGSDWLSIVVTLGAMVVALTLLGYVANSLGQTGTYGLIGAAILLALAAGIVAMAGAAMLLSKVPLADLSKGLTEFTNTLFSKDNAGKTWALVAYLIALSIACALLAPGVILIGGALSVLALALSVLLNALSEFSTHIDDLLNKLGDLWAIFKMIGNDLYDNGGKVAAISVLIGLLGGAMLIVAIDAAIMAGSLVLLGIGLISCGAGLALINLTFTLLVKAMTEFINAINSLVPNLDKIKEAIVGIVCEIFNSLAKLAENSEGLEQINLLLMQIGLSLTALAIAMVLFGAATIVNAVAILALAGALAVLSVVFKKCLAFEALLNMFEEVWADGGKIAATGAAFIAFGAGTLIAAIGILAVSGALAVLSNTLKLISWEDLMSMFENLWENGGKMALVSLALVAFGIGTGIAALGVLALGAALAVFGTGLTTVGVGLGVVNLAIIGLGDSIESLGKGIGVFISIISSAVESGAITRFAQGMFKLAIVFAGMAIVCAVLGLLAPYINDFTEAMNNLIPVIASLIVLAIMFSTACKKMAGNVCDSMMRLTITIIECINEIMDFVSSGGFSAGFAWAEEFVDGIKSGFSAIKNTTQLIADGLYGYIFNDSNGSGSAGSSRSTKSKRRARKRGEEVANDIGSGLKDGLNSLINNIKENGSEIGGSLIDSIKQKLEGTSIKEKLSELFGGEGGFMEGISAIWGGGSLSDILGGVFGDGLDISGNLDELTGGMNDFSASGEQAESTFDKLKGTIENQIKMFEEFDDATDMAAADLLKNMRSQINGITNWANGIETLGLRGMSAELIQYLSEMGPEGYKYVEAFLDMTEEELAEANDLYSQSLTLPTSATNTVLEGYRYAGATIVEGVASGISGSTAASEAMEETADDVVDIAGDAGERAGMYYVARLHKWLTSEEYQAACEEYKEKLAAIFFTDEELAKIARDQALAEMGTYDGWLKDGWYYVSELDKWLNSSEYEKYCKECKEQVRALFFTDEEYQEMMKNYFDPMKNYKGSDSDEVYEDAGKDNAEHFLDGFEGATNDFDQTDAILNGFKAANSVTNVVEAGTDLGKKTYDGINTGLGIRNGESDKAKTAGSIVAESMANGIIQYTSVANKATEDMCDTMLKTISTKISEMTTVLTSDIDANPVITPVVDTAGALSSIESLNTAIGNSRIGATANSYAYMTDSRNRLAQEQTAMSDATLAKNIDRIVDAIANGTTPVTLNVTLEGDASGIFKMVQKENLKAVKARGSSPLAIGIL